MAKKLTKADFDYLATQTGAALEYEVTEGGRHRRTGELIPWSITLDAPKGKIFRGSFCHVDCSLQGTTARVDWDLAFRGLREILEDGFLDCEDEECEVCHGDSEG